MACSYYVLKCPTQDVSAWAHHVQMIASGVGRLKHVKEVTFGCGKQQKQQDTVPSDQQPTRKR
eukprot:CAMPEP_0194052170 /NCGR_PEP_ID=MMETSP0009_2-20130614/44315_1 /TAXON_ID=210454 /ORGANISM="Grammatophora oceanica, Strain CCMP 410" /LENGTH=62 /DNA_ID=CAMNT_0038699633 /DNA_START=190 /DNA_END=375 /DNA_ORIENTATION=-